jgi:hypothetical protein
LDGEQFGVVDGFEAGLVHGSFLSREGRGRGMGFGRWAGW